MQTQPPFGQADLSNCERELVHLAGSVQPRGVLLVLEQPSLDVMQVSRNCGLLLGVPAEELLRRPLWTLGGDVETQVRALAAGAVPEPAPFRRRVDSAGRTRAQVGGHRLGAVPPRQADGGDGGLAGVAPQTRLPRGMDGLQVDEQRTAARA